MSPRHHPPEDALLAYATAAMPPGAALTIQVHLHFCAQCRATLRFLDSVGGLMLSEAEPAKLAAGAADRAVSAVAALPFEAPGRAPIPTIAEVITSLEHGPWGPFLPGLQVANVNGEFEADETVCLLKCEAGSAVPGHSHEQMERFVVLEGGFGVDDTVYWPGDYIEAGDDITHTPFIPVEGDCLCLFALQGGLVFVEPQAPAPET